MRKKIKLNKNTFSCLFLNLRTPVYSEQAERQISNLEKTSSFVYIIFYSFLNYP